MEDKKEVILALDQSSRISGYSVFKDKALFAFDKFTFEDSDLDTRLMKIRFKVQDLIEQYTPDKVILEDIQLQNNVANNVQTYKALAEVQGVIVELLKELNIPYEIISAATWKSTLGIKGRSRPEQKKNAQQYVLDKYSSIGVISQDIADAICIGIHYIESSINDWSN